MSASDRQAGQAESGYAVLAAMLAAACFALLAGQVVSTSRSAVQSANAELTRAKLEAAADAGQAMALDGLSTDDPNARWDIDGRPRHENFEGADLTVTVEDERGKVPLDLITPAQARTLFARAGADPAELDGLVEAFLDARDPSRVARAPGATVAPEAGTPPTQGFEAVSDLARVPGVTPALYAALARSVTVSADDAAFDPRTATPLALEVMGGAGADAPSVIERQRELAGQRPALDIVPPIDLVGRALTIRVTAESGRDGRFEAASVVELTGRPERPYLVRARLQ